MLTFVDIATLLGFFVMAIAAVAAVATAGTWLWETIVDAVARRKVALIIDKAQVVTFYTVSESLLKIVAFTTEGAAIEFEDNLKKSPLAFKNVQRGHQVIHSSAQSAMDKELRK